MAAVTCSGDHRRSTGCQRVSVSKQLYTSLVWTVFWTRKLIHSGTRMRRTACFETCTSLETNRIRFLHTIYGRKLRTDFLCQHGNPSGITQELLCIKLELVSHSGLGYLQS